MRSMSSAMRLPARVEVPLKLLPFVDAHPAQLGQRVLHGLIDQPAPIASLAPGVRHRRLLTNRDGMRQAQQVARRQVSGNRPRAAGRAPAPPPAPSTNGLVELDVRHGRLPQLHAHAQLDAPARDGLLHQRANARLAVGQRLRQPQLDVEEPMVDGAHGDAHGRPLVFARQRRKSGHARDHSDSALPRRPSCAGGHRRDGLVARLAALQQLQLVQPRIQAAAAGQQSSCRPTSTIRPRSMTRIASARRIVDRRCAMTNDVRFFIRLTSASCTSCSDSVSSDEVASSRISSGESFSKRARDGQTLPLPA